MPVYFLQPEQLILNLSANSQTTIYQFVNQLALPKIGTLSSERGGLALLSTRLRQFKSYSIKIMGEAKRRKTALGEKYGQEPQIFPWLPITKSQAQQINKWVNRGAKIGIGFLIAWWVIIRFVGPAFGWWQVV